MAQRVAFVQKDPLPDPLAARLAAELVFLGDEVDIFLPGAEARWPEPLREYAPALVVFHCFTGMEAWASEQARLVRRATGGAPIVMIGQHATDHPSVADGDPFDLAVPGAGDGVLPALLWRIQREKPLDGTPGTQCVRGGQPVEAPPLAVAPMQQGRVEDYESYRRYPFIQELGTLSFVTGRGTLENCHALWRATRAEVSRRFRPVERLDGQESLRRLHLHLQRRPETRRVAFRDDSLLLGPDAGLLDFLLRYRDEVGRPFSALARPDLLSDRRISALREAGCDTIKLDVVPASGADRLGQGIDPELIARTAESLSSAGIRVCGVAFAGWPDEGLESLARTLESLAQLPLTRCCVVPFADSEAGGPGPAVRRLARLGPLAARHSALVPIATKVAAWLPDAAVRPLFQAHHDLSFATSGEIGAVALLRLAASMRRVGHRLDA